MNKNISGTFAEAAGWGYAAILATTFLLSAAGLGVASVIGKTFPRTAHFVSRAASAPYNKLVND